MSLRPRLSLVVPAILLGTLSACNAWQATAEFAAPQSRWPATLPSTAQADAMPTPVPMQYCYKTLASVDCYTETKPDRVTGFTGSYPGNN